MLERIPSLKPLHVLVDRSRDDFHGMGLVEARPDGVFRVTDHRTRLNRRALRGYDILAIVSIAARAYSKAEREAVRDFVRRGGALLLASGAGEFEAEAGRPAPRLALNGIARLFGFEFLTPEAGPDPVGIRGYEHRELEAGPGLREFGLRLGDIWMLHTGPIKAPPGASVLARVKATGEPVAARAKFGRGTVAVFGSVWPFSAWGSLAPKCAMASLATGRRAGGPPPPPLRDTTYVTVRRGEVTVRHTAQTANRAESFADLVARILETVGREVPSPKPAKGATVRLVPGTGASVITWGPADLVLTLGADRGRASAVFEIALRVTLWRLTRWWGHRSWQFVHSAGHAVGLRVLEQFGHHAEAERRRAAAGGGESLDLGRLYTEVRPRHAQRRFFDEVTRQFGPSVLRRLCRAMPKKEPLKPFPAPFLTRFDAFAHYLSLAAGPDVYDWLEAEGHSFRRIGPAKPGTGEFETRWRTLAERVLAGPAESPADRVDAANALTTAGSKAKTGGLVRSARGQRAERAIPAALRLARVRDERGAEHLRRWLGSEDEGLAAVVALLLAKEAGDREAADHLGQVAGRHEARFRLLAGRVLERMGHPEAKRHAFDAVPGCEREHVRRGVVTTYAVVDGNRIAITNGEPRWFGRGHGAAVSDFHISWVHTDPRWRGRGLARVAFEDVLRHRWASECSSITLEAETEYFAQVLYRNWGLFERRRFRWYRRVPLAAVRARAPSGVRLRRARSEDREEATDLIRRAHADRGALVPRLANWPADDIAYLAREEERTVGVLWLAVSSDATRAREFAVEQFEGEKGSRRREKVALALLAAGEREAARRKVKELRAFTWTRADDDFSRRMFRRAGWEEQPQGLAEFSRVTDPVRYFTEMRVALEARLTDHRRWRGAIRLTDGDLTVGLEVRDGRVKVEDVESPTIEIEGGTESVQRILLGTATPVEEQLEDRVRIRPGVNPETSKLLSALFARTAEQAR